MLENLNYELFYLLNATPASPEWMIDLATFIAKDVISIVPALAVILWLWGPRTQVTAQRHLVIKMAMATATPISTMPDHRRCQNRKASAKVKITVP